MTKKLIIKKENLKTCIILLVALVSTMAYFFTKNALLSYIIFVPVLVILFTLAIKKPIYLIFSILFISTDAMGLLPSIPLKFGTFMFSDLLIPYIFFIYLLVIKYKAKYKFDFLGSIIILFLVFRVIGAIRGNLIYGQNFLSGMLTLRESYIFLLYFPISAFIRKGTFTKEELLDEIYKFTKTYSVFLIIQLILLFLGFSITNYSYDFRWGYRIRASNLLQVYSFLYLLYNLFTTKKVNKTDLLWLIIFVFMIVFINQSRLIIMGTAITSIIMIILNNNTKRKIAIIFLCIISALVLLTNSNIRGIISESVIESKSNESGSMLYRKYEKSYFNEKLSGHELLGVGTPNMHNGEAAIYSGMLKEKVYKGYYMNGFYTSDLGVYAIKYYWGIIGIAIYWFLIIVCILITFNYTYLKKQYSIYNFLTFSFLLFNIINSYTLCFFITQPVMFLIMFIIGSNIKYNQ